MLDSAESLAMLAWPFSRFHWNISPTLLGRNVPATADGGQHTMHRTHSFRRTEEGSFLPMHSSAADHAQSELEVDAAELLLETYLAEVEVRSLLLQRGCGGTSLHLIPLPFPLNAQAVYRRLGRCRDSLTSAEHQYHLVLNQSRNKLIRVNLFITVTTMFVGIVMLIPSIFGMNLTSGLEDKARVFNEVTIVSCVLLVALVLTSYRLLSVYAK